MLLKSIGNPNSPFGETGEGYYPLPDSRTVGLAEGLAMVRRHLKLIVLVVGICTTIAALLAFSLPKKYTAVSTLVLERTDTRPFETDEELQRQERDKSATETEMDIISSRQFAARIVDRLNLIANPQFNTFLQKNNDGSWSTRFSDLLRRSGVSPDSLGASRTLQLPSVARQRDRAISKLLSELEVTRSGESLAVSIHVTNGDPDLAANIANSIATIYVDASLEAKKDVRAEHNARASASGGAVSFLRERITQPLLTTLRNEEAEAVRERAQLATLYGVNHPKIAEADAKIASVRKLINEEIQHILTDLDTEAAKPSARVVSEAEVPEEPSFPKPRLVIGSGFVGSILLSLLLVILLEFSDSRIRNGEKIARLLRIPNLGYIPQIPARRRKEAKGLINYVVKNPQSAFAEALRSIYLLCRISGTDRSFQTVLLTSCLPGEGKTSLALGIACTAALDGRRTILVDFDLHVSGVSREVKEQKATLADFLVGTRSLDEILAGSNYGPGLDIISGRVSRPEQAGLLRSERLREMIRWLRERYDFIVIDTPPILIVDDANWLAPLVDSVFLVTKWGKTTEDAACEAAARLRMNHAPLAGTIINQVDPRLHAKYGYGGPIKYYRQSSGYIH